MFQKTAPLLLIISAVLLSACATPGSNSASGAPAATGANAPKIVKSRDGKFEGEVFGAPAPGGQFSKLQIGMEFQEVTKLIGAPHNMHTHETGKRWIPFYYGNDARRMQTLYRSEGCLTFTGGNIWGGGGNELVAIHHDKSEKCYAE